MDDYELMEDYIEFEKEDIQANYENDYDPYLSDEAWEALRGDREKQKRRKMESIGAISDIDYIKWVQRSLNRILGLKLLVNGKPSTSYRDAVWWFNKEYVKTKKTDDRVDELTQNAIILLNEKNRAYMLWVQKALRKTGAELAPTGVKDKSTRTYLHLFQVYSELKEDAFVGAKTETALIKASGILPPGHIQPNPSKPPSEKELAKQLLHIIPAIERETRWDAIDKKRILCLIRKITSNIVDGEPLNDEYVSLVDTLYNPATRKFTHHFKTDLMRRYMGNKDTTLKQGIFTLYSEMMKPLVNLRKKYTYFADDLPTVPWPGSPTRREILYKSEPCQTARSYFIKQALNSKSLYNCPSIRKWILSEFSECI